jgi:hypothetical protein
MGGLFESLGKYGGDLYQIYNAQKRQEDARQEYEDRFNKMDLQYAQTAETAPEYKVAESPVARAYLESFLTGSNPDAIQGTRLGADATREQAAGDFKRDYGTYSDLVRSGREERSDGRFHVDPSRPVDEDQWGQADHRYALQGKLKDGKYQG